MKPMWKEGLCVTPQHLQQMDGYIQRLVDQRVNCVRTYGWGVAKLEIDEEALSRGLFQLERCVAVMPDGLLVEVGPDAPAKGAVVMTSGKLMEGDQGREVYLCVPGNIARGTTRFATNDGREGARFVSYSQQTKDDFGMAAEADVDFVRPNVQLLLDSDDRQGYITIKIADLELGEGGALRVSQEYVPPCLSIGASPLLKRRLAQLVNALSAKQNSLAERYRGRSNALVEFGAVEMATFWYLHTVNSVLPPLMHLASQGDVHPESLYLALVALAGQLTTFEQDLNPQGLPRYDHLDLAGTFFPLFERLFDMLGTVVAQQYEAIPLQQTQPGLFVGRVETASLLRGSQLFLVASGDVPENALREDVPRYIKVSSLDQIANIVQAATTGIGTEIDLSPPTAIPVRAGHVYLRLDQQGVYWEDVLRSNSIAIYQPVLPDQIKLELLAVES